MYGGRGLKNVKVRLAAGVQIPREALGPRGGRAEALRKPGLTDLVLPLAHPDERDLAVRRIAVLRVAVVVEQLVVAVRAKHLEHASGYFTIALFSSTTVQLMVAGGIWPIPPRNALAVVGLAVGDVG
jgi:hypothetical protein